MTQIAEKKEISIAEAAKYFETAISENINLIEKGKKGFTYNFIGKPGIGKTSLFYQISSKTHPVVINNKTVDLPIKVTIIRLSNFQDSGDITGIPADLSTFKLRYDKKDIPLIISTKEKLDLVKNKEYIDSIVNSLDEIVHVRSQQSFDYSYLYKATGQIQTTYAIPKWVPSDENFIHILVFDDANRCEDIVQNTIMPVILEKESVSYKLPKYTIIALTSNPDDGINKVNYEDEAQATRKIDIKVKFTHDAWYKYAINKMNTSLVMFLNEHKDFVLSSQDDLVLNPRYWEMVNDSMSLLLQKLEASSPIKEDGIQQRPSKEFNDLLIKVVNHLSTKTNTLIAAKFKQYVLNNTISLPDMNDFMLNWSDTKVKRWLATQIGIKNNQKDVSLSLALYNRIYSFLKQQYSHVNNKTKTNDLTDDAKKAFKRFARLYWDINESYRETDNKKCLKFMVDNHLVLLGNLVSKIPETVIKDTENNFISLRSLKAEFVNNLIITDKAVSKLLKNPDFEDSLSFEMDF